MTGNRVAPPPASLLRAVSAAPAAATATAEVRTDASIPFDPTDAPGYLVIAQAQFGAMVIWRLDTSWPHAQRIQGWLIDAPPAGVPGANQEAALADLIENLVVNPESGEASIEYIGTHLASANAHPTYTVLIGLRHPVQRDAYQDAWLQALNALSATNPPWHQRVVEFLRLFLAEPGVREEFTMLASSVGDLKANDPTSGNPRYPTISLLLP